MEFRINNTHSINETLKKLSSGDTLFLEKGIYKEKIEVLIDNITIIGEDRENTIIENHDWFHKVMKDYQECNTFRTFTLYVGSNNVNLKNLTVKNTCTPSSKYGQAVSLHVDGNNFNCSDCNILGAQDTLFTGPLPKDLIKRHEGFLKDYFRKDTPSFQYYKNCKIEGDTDFIFGSAQAIFYNCTIVSIGNNKVFGDTKGYIAAPSHDKDMKFGYLFYKCNLIKDETLESKVFLARPWRDYGEVAFIECNIGDHINPLGFNKWNNTNRDKTARFYEYSQNIDLSKREPWAHELNKEQANQYVKDYLKEYNINKNIFE